jgi:phosphoglycerate dehydrogenase-like enzyme
MLVVCESKATMPTTLLVLCNPTAPHLKHLDRLPPETNIIVSDDPAELRRRAADADAILSLDFAGKKLGPMLPFATRARWIHHFGTGVDTVLTPEVLANSLPLTNGRGVFRVPLGEWTVAAMLFFSYDLRRVIRQQEAGMWQPFDSGMLQGKTLGIIGYGGIGSAAAERARPFGMKIVALRRRAALFANDPLLDGTFAPERINDLMAASDYVLVAAPLTPETRGMVGAAQIAAMKPTGVIINVGRGPVIDQAALQTALESGKIRGAALDVFEVEPLPAGHAFYKMQNVLVSPHTADRVEDFHALAYPAFFENFRRFEAGEPFLNLVDKHAGY